MRLVLTSVGDVTLRLTAAMAPMKPVAPVIIRRYRYNTLSITDYY